jgi:hypothetical protein
MKVIIVDLIENVTMPLESIVKMLLPVIPISSKLLDHLAIPSNNNGLPSPLKSMFTSITSTSNISVPSA